MLLYNLKYKMKKILNKKRLFIIIPIILYILFQIVLYASSIQINKIPESFLIYDSNEKIIGEIIKDKKYRHTESKIDGIPSFFKNTIVQIEDKSFYDNNWISFKSLIRATTNNIKAKAFIEWASTISSQLIRNNLWVNQDRTLKQKLLEFYLAMVLNKKYSKDQILEKYINMLSFGNLCYGPQAAARYYFWKTLNNLTKAEQLALITIPKNPNKYNPLKNYPLFEKRFLNLAKYLLSNNIISKDEYDDIIKEKLLFKKEDIDNLPYITDFIKLKYFSKENNIWYKAIFSDQKLQISSEIKTTIDADVTKQIEEIATSSLRWLAWKWVTDYWIIIIDRKTMGIKTMIWWADYKSSDWQVNSVIALRQPGSSIKPFTYVLAFKDKWLKPADTIEDLPVHFQTAKWYSYTPKNYTLKYKGQVTIATALSESLNVPAVKVLDMIWTQRLLDFLKNLWVSSLNENAEHYWLALTLWVWEMSLYELTRAYWIFANQWKLCEIKILEDENSQCESKIDNKYIEDIVLILTNRFFKINWFPINSNLDFPDRYVFVKTWTSREFKDNFAIWFTNNYLIWVWVWNKSWEKMKLVTGVAGAWDIFRKIVYKLQDQETENKPVNLDIVTKKYLEIINPANWSKYKLEPQKQNQTIKLEFSTNYSYTNYAWILDGKKLDENFFTPSIWVHSLKLLMFEAGQKISEVENKFIVE